MQYRNMKLPMNADKGSLSVIGSSSLEVKCDLALLNLSVISQGPILEEVSNENSRISNDLLISLNNYGISNNDIHNENIFVTRNYDNNNELSSYKVTKTIVINVKDFSKLNDIYSLAIKNGANGDMNINFILSNPSYYYNKALKHASQDALVKASLLAKNFGVKYNPIPHKIQENSSSLYSITYPSSNYNYYPNLAPSFAKITAEVQAIFTTYPY
ncbi:DUF541 domain-containing protein [Romboutsia maritimum]|uniref:DUF541 domain-containing protein n=1 Tax=Romboutsia maritimum TaxID=2020948 RepID=A0A371IVJ5_9FIRM|nr:SIMPL domain-containing protein [Romboutsia maritimum]RDY24479.1 DUF541 domain-containing protein [Romboutsia maritimum]